VFENRIGECREAKGLKLSEIAGALRVDQSTVWRWEKTGRVPDDRKHQLAELLGVSIAYLMGWTEREAA
jgi:transcriptional regulator with XRE-family HTH domain